MGKVILIGSQKNDIGKTIICIKLGINISDMGKRVILMDLSTGKKKISEYLNVNEEIIYDIKDVLESTCSLEQAAIEINDNLSLIPSPRIVDKLKDIKIEEFLGLIKDAEKSYDVILIDVDKISSSYIDFDLITHIILVNNNDFSCVKELNTDKMIAGKFNVNRILPVLNKYNRKSANKGSMINSKDIQKMTDMNMDIVIEDNIKYLNADCDFIVSKDDNSFNKAIKLIENNITS